MAQTDATVPLRLRWEENTAPALEAAIARDPVVVLPVGSVEQHGRHVPVGCDARSAEAVVLRAAEGLTGREPPVLVLPTLWYGYSPHHMAFRGTVTLQSDTFLRVVQDIVESVLAHGVRRVAIVNGHGGNVSSLDVVASRLGHAWHGRARIAVVTYYQLAAPRLAEFRESGPGGMGHACEFETSVQLALNPGLVRMEAAVSWYPEPPSPRQSTDLFGASLVRSYHDFRDLSPSGTFGDPSLASPAKGETILRICVDELRAFLAEFAGWPMT
ncbi:MAG: creatininase family protein [Rhodospirillaceae bacterium]|nr:creatininase family protein [Rhodospirillaceae bacterium]